MGTRAVRKHRTLFLNKIAINRHMKNYVFNDMDEF